MFPLSKHSKRKIRRGIGEWQERDKKSGPLTLEQLRQKMIRELLTPEEDKMCT